jgi:hypothetical protein
MAKYTEADLKRGREVADARIWIGPGKGSPNAHGAVGVRGALREKIAHAYAEALAEGREQVKK